MAMILCPMTNEGAAVYVAVEIWPAANVKMSISFLIVHSHLLSPQDRS